MKHIVTLLADTVGLFVWLLFRDSDVKGSLLILRTLIDSIDLSYGNICDLLLYFKMHTVTGWESEDTNEGGGGDPNVVSKH